MSSDFDVFEKLAEYEQQIESKSPKIEDITCHVTPLIGSGCKHINVSTDCGITECLDCGEQISTVVSTESKMFVSTDNRTMGDGNRCWAPTKKTKGIREDVKGLGFPDPVINKAEDIFKVVTEGNIFRVDKRKSIIVACLLEAYKILKIPITLETLLQRIPTENITVGTKLVETKIKKYDTERTRVTYSSPEDSIRDIMAHWDSDPETLNRVIELYRSVDNQSQLLNRSRPRSVAAGVIYYYVLSTKRDNITLSAFSEVAKLSESTIQKIAREISAILKTKHVLSY